MTLFAPLAEKSPFDDPDARHAAGRHGMMLLLVSLGVLFAATMIGLVVVRVQLGQRGAWPDVPALPRGLALSTLVLLVSSATMHRAVNASRGAAASSARCRRALHATLALGTLFLAVQAACWLAWLGPVRALWSDSEAWRLALTGFYVLTGLHGLHVAGGLVALGGALRRAHGPGFPTRAVRAPVEFCAMYWHFLGIVWLGVYGLLLVWS